MPLLLGGVAGRFNIYPRLLPKLYHSHKCAWHSTHATARHCIATARHCIARHAATATHAATHAGHHPHGTRHPTWCRQTGCNICVDSPLKLGWKSFQILTSKLLRSFWNFVFLNQTLFNLDLQNRKKNIATLATLGSVKPWYKYV